MRVSTALIFFVIPIFHLFAQEVDVFEKRLEFHGYSTVNYHFFHWESDPNKKNVFDLERVTFEPTFWLSEHIKFQLEVEIEHGGTGSTMEYEKFEEFGEFEAEIEKGGEIVIEQAALVTSIYPQLNFRIGHFLLPIGYMGYLDETTDYSTVERSEMERGLLPSLWHETGLAIFGNWQNYRYELQLVNGLDATGFSSANWIAGGHQKRFEHTIAEDFALVGRLDAQFWDECELGVSGYYGNSQNNRPKDDLKVPAYIGIFSIHSKFNYQAFNFRSVLLYGYLQNSEEISRVNRSLPNALGVNRTAVGENAMGFFGELVYNVLYKNPLSENFDPSRPQKIMNLYIRYDFYDSMYNTSRNITDIAKWERSVYSYGISYGPITHFNLKAQHSVRLTGARSDNLEQTISLGMGVEF